MEKENKREAGTKHCRTDMGGGGWETGWGRKKRGLEVGQYVCMYEELNKCCELGGVALSHKSPDLHEN